MTIDALIKLTVTQRANEADRAAADGLRPVLIHDEDGWGVSVEDEDGGTWHPGQKATATIAASDNAFAEAVRLAASRPMLGEWHS